MQSKTIPTSIDKTEKHDALCKRLAAFLLKTRKRNLSLNLMGDDEHSAGLVGSDFKSFEEELTCGLQLTSYDRLRIEKRAQRLLGRSSQ